MPSSPSTIVVPFVPHANDLRRSAGHSGTQVLTTRDLLNGLAQRILPPHRIVTPELTRALVSSILLTSTDSQSPVSQLGPHLSPTHLARALDRSMGLVAQSDVPPQSLRTLADSPALSTRDQRRASLLAFAIDALEARLAALSAEQPQSIRLLDGRFLESILADCMAKNGDESVEQAVVSWLGRRVRVENVLELSPSWLRMFEELTQWLVKYSGQLLFEFPLVRSRLAQVASSDAPDNVYSATVLRRIESFSFNEPPQLRSVGQAFTDAATTPMSQCVDACFTEGATVLSHAEGISIQLVKSSRDEAEVVVREVVRALHDYPDIGPEDIAVALGDLDIELCAELTRGFAEAAVPAHFERSDPPESAPLIGWFFRLCDDAASNALKRSTLLDAVGSGFGAALWIGDATSPEPQIETASSHQPDADLPFPDSNASSTASVADTPDELPAPLDELEPEPDYLDAIMSTMGDGEEDPSIAVDIEAITARTPQAAPTRPAQVHLELDKLLRDLRQVDLPLLRATTAEQDPLALALDRLERERQRRFNQTPGQSCPVRSRLVSRLCHLRNTLLALGRAKTRTECLSAIANLALELRLSKKARSELGEAVRMPRSLSRARILTAAARDQEAVAALDDCILALRQANALAKLNKDPSDIPSTLLELREALAGRSPRGASAFGAVSVERVGRRIGRSAEVLILAATHEGCLPKRGGDDPLLTPSIISALRDLHPQRAPLDSSVRESATMLAALDTLGLTKRRVVVVTRIHDVDNSRIPPGVLVSELSYRAGIAPAGADLSDVEKHGALHARTRPIRPMTALRSSRDAQLYLAFGRAKSEKEAPCAASLWSAQRAWIEKKRQTLFAKRLASPQEDAKPEASGEEQPNELARRDEPHMLWPAVARREDCPELDGLLGHFYPEGWSNQEQVSRAQILRWQENVMGSGVPNTAQKVLSATTVEAYAQCHFRGWIEKGLRASTTEEADEELDIRVSGTFIHGVLQAMYGRVPTGAWSSKNKLHEQTLQEAEAIVEQAIEDMKESGVLFEGLRELDLLLFKRDLVNLLRKDLRSAEYASGLQRVPLAFEAAFGEDSEPLVLRNADGSHELAIRGRFDRVDALTFPDGSRGYLVIDYKSRTKKLSSPPLFVTSIQLPLYALAVRSLGLLGADKESAVDAAFVGYRRAEGMSTKWAAEVNGKKPGTLGSWNDALAQQQLPETSPFARSLVHLFETRLRAGYVSANGEEDHCNYCKLRPACRKPLLNLGEDSDETDTAEQGNP